MHWNLLLDLQGTAHRPINTVKYDEKRIAGDVDDPSAMLGDRRVNQVAAQHPQPFERASIIQTDEAAVPHDVGVHHGD
jgi:hypothetical protein